MAGLPAKMNEQDLKLRPNVAAILLKPSGKILICERLHESGAWQFPQGGVDPGESLETAIIREIWEEISLKQEKFRIREQKGPYIYYFPEGMRKKGHAGKTQYYFLCDFLGEDSDISVATSHPEFRAFKWIKPEDFKIHWLPEMKKKVYKAVFSDFFGLILKD